MVGALGAGSVSDPEFSVELSEVRQEGGQWVLGVVVINNTAMDRRLSKYDITTSLLKTLFCDQSSHLWKFFAQPFPLIGPPPLGTDLIGVPAGHRLTVEVEAFQGLELCNMDRSGKTKAEAGDRPDRLWFLVRGHVRDGTKPLTEFTIGGCGATKVLWGKVPAE